jgi:hypothetical protein
MRLLAAEIKAELGRIEITVSEIADASAAVACQDSTRLSLYGAAALLETFYTGIEKVLTRTGRALGGLPDGPGWHRRLLEDATLDLPTMRPPILSQKTLRLLEPYLAFRHRFRNLYLFDLEQNLVSPLLGEVPKAWEAASRDLLGFCDRLDKIADQLGE